MLRAIHLCAIFLFAAAVLANLARADRSSVPGVLATLALAAAAGSFGVSGFLLISIGPGAPLSLRPVVYLVGVAFAVLGLLVSLL